MGKEIARPSTLFSRCRALRKIAFTQVGIRANPRDPGELFFFAYRRSISVRRSRVSRARTHARTRTRRQEYYHHWYRSLGNERGTGALAIQSLAYLVGRVNAGITEQFNWYTDTVLLIQIIRQSLLRCELIYCNTYVALLVQVEQASQLDFQMNLME